MALGAGKLVGEKPRCAGQLPEEGPSRSHRTRMILQTLHISRPVGETEAELVLAQGLAKSVICRHAWWVLFNQSVWQISKGS